MRGSFDLGDALALAWFVLAWSGYHFGMERGRASRPSLNAVMHGYRLAWMRQMMARENRIVDASIMASLQNGTAFFASTSLLASGGALALLRLPDDGLLALGAVLPAGAPSRVAWEMKSVGLVLILVYAFFKFAWSYRLFNYTAILVGAAPPAAQRDTAEGRAHALRAAGLATAAGRHFNRGQRAFFFALAYLGWFVAPSVLVATTTAVLLVMGARQLASDALRAVMIPPESDGSTPP